MAPPPMFVKAGRTNTLAIEGIGLLHVLEQQRAKGALKLFAGFGDPDEHAVDEVKLVFDRCTGCGKIVTLFFRSKKGDFGPIAVQLVFVGLGVMACIFQHVPSGRQVSLVTQHLLDRVR